MSKYQRAYKNVITYFKNEIAKGNYKVGEKLPPEREIAEMLGVSRNSVREAMRIMDMTGVITSLQGSGNYISCDFEKSITESMYMMFALDQTDYSQLIQLRRALESMAAALAVDNASDEDIQQIASYVREIDWSEDRKRNVELDKQIHYTLAHVSGNRLIETILKSLSATIDTFIKDMHYEILRTEERKRLLNEAHAEIVDALNERSRKKVQAALDKHFDLLEQIVRGEIN